MKNLHWFKICTDIVCIVDMNIEAQWKWNKKRNSIFLGLFAFDCNHRPDLHLAYIYRCKVNSNWTQYSRPAIFW